MTEAEPDSSAELRVIAEEMFALVTRLYQESPAVAAADDALCRRLRRCQWLLNPWLESMNFFGNGLEVLRRETYDKDH